MIALDTNALLRYLDVSAALHERETLFLSTVAIVETVWVLARRLKVPKTDIIAALRDLLAVPGIVLEQPGTVQRALSMWDGGPADFADYVQLDVARSAGATELATFDQDLQRSPGTRAPVRR